MRFNPRLREGGDAAHFCALDCDDVSIHASAREATRTTRLVFTPLWVSIHASAREATSVHGLQDRKVGFNPRLREGGDYLVKMYYFTYNGFNPRLREGGDYA